MIITVEQVFDVKCDSCGFVQGFRVKTWRDLLSEMRTAGWFSSKGEDGKWINKCSRCRWKR